MQNNDPYMLLWFLKRTTCTKCSMHAMNWIELNDVISLKLEWTTVKWILQLDKITFKWLGYQTTVCCHIVNYEFTE